MATDARGRVHAYLYSTVNPVSQVTHGTCAHLQYMPPQVFRFSTYTASLQIYCKFPSIFQHLEFQSFYTLIGHFTVQATIGRIWAKLLICKRNPGQFGAVGEHGRPVRGRLNYCYIYKNRSKRKNRANFGSRYPHGRRVGVLLYRADFET
jgi:hypothetical protein